MQIHEKSNKFISSAFKCVSIALSSIAQIDHLQVFQHPNISLTVCLLASAGTDQAVQVHDIIKGNQPMLYMGHKSNVTAVTWLTYNTVISLDESGKVHI